MGPASSAGADKFEPISNINITPLVDVSLVLVIIFMLTMPYLMEKSMKVSAENGGDSSAAVPHPPIVVQIERAEIRVDGRPTPMREVSPILKRLIKERGSSSVEISAAREVEHGQVVAVMDQVADAGIADLNLRPPQEGSLER